MSKSKKSSSLPVVETDWEALERLCPRCNKNEKGSGYPCPYESEMSDTGEEGCEDCFCCIDCRHECAMDV